MSTSHLDRKALKRPDAFLEKSQGAIHFFSENARVLAGGVAALFAIGLALVFYNSMKEKKSGQASDAFFLAKRSLTAALAANSKSADWDKKISREIEGLESVALKFKGTQAAFDARLSLGDIYFEHGNAAKAIEEYNQALQSTPSRSVKALAQYALAYAQESNKDYETAIHSFSQVLGSGDQALKGDALMALAREYELKGDKTKAIEQYDIIARDFVNTPLARSAEMHRQRLR